MTSFERSAGQVRCLSSGHAICSDPPAVLRRRSPPKYCSLRMHRPRELRPESTAQDRTKAGLISRIEYASVCPKLLAGICPNLKIYNQKTDLY